MTKPELDKIKSNGAAPISFSVDDALKCPACGGDYLHQEEIEVFWRKEDAQTGIHVFTDGVKLTQDVDISGNPSPRRQGLRILFTCEMCPAEPTLNIIQHKGNTYGWFSWKQTA